MSCKDDTWRAAFQNYRQTRTVCTCKLQIGLGETQDSGSPAPLRQESIDRNRHRSWKKDKACQHVHGSNVRTQGSLDQRTPTNKNHYEDETCHAALQSQRQTHIACLCKLHICLERLWTGVLRPRCTLAKKA